MKFNVQNVVYVRSNGELSHEISLGTVGYLADSLSDKKLPLSVWTGILFLFI